MPNESFILVTDITDESADSSVSYSDKNQGSGYHRKFNGTHTAVYFLNNFSGIIKLQGTLHLHPTDDDWVDIDDTEFGGDSAFSSGGFPVTFVGNFIWVRAAYAIYNGSINKIQYTH